MANHVIVGMHLFAVSEDLSKKAGQTINHHPGPNHMVITMALNYDFHLVVHQWCPPLTRNDRQEIFNLFNTREPKRGHDVHYYAVELGRILGTKGLLQNLVNVTEDDETPRLPFTFWKCYQMTDHQLELSKHIAINVSQGLPWVHNTSWHLHGVGPTNTRPTIVATFGSDIPESDEETKFSPPTFTPIRIRASTRLQQHYRWALPALRLQWLEKQNEIVEMEEFTVEVVELTKSDKARGHDAPSDSPDSLGFSHNVGLDDTYQQGRRGDDGHFDRFTPRYVCDCYR